jgi:hypothetical protein
MRVKRGRAGITALTFGNQIGVCRGEEEKEGGLLDPQVPF